MKPKMYWVPSWQQEGDQRDRVFREVNSEREISARSGAAVQGGGFIWEGRCKHKLVSDIVRGGWFGGSGWFAELVVGVASLRTVAQQRGGQVRSWSLGGGSCRHSACLSGYLPLCSQLLQPPLQKKSSPCGLVGWGGSKSNLKTRTYLYRWKKILIFLLLEMLLAESASSWKLYSHLLHCAWLF